MKDLMGVFHRACQRVEAGDYEGALEDFLWLHDHPVKGIPSSEVHRRAFGFFAWAQLGRSYPPALDKMRELLETKKSHLALHPDDTYTAADAGAMHQALMSIVENQRLENQKDP